MKSSILLLAATAVSASVIPPLKLGKDAFPKFHTLSLEDAINGVDLIVDNVLDPLLGGHHNHSSTTEGPETAAPVPAANTEAPAAVVPSTLNSAAAAACAANPQIRWEWRSYSVPDRQKFVAAIKCLVDSPPSGNFPPATNRFEDLARLHQIYMPNVHGNSEFLVWHRYFLWTFEQLLQTECGLDIPMPWWDETKDAADFAANNMFSNNYFGHLDGPDHEGDPTCLTSGVFANMVAHIGPGNSNIPHCLSRSWESSQTQNCNTNFVNTCNSRTSYADMESCSEDG